jgi:hypothetical protein
MLNFRKISLPVLAGVILSLASVARADIVYNNTAAASDGQDPVQGFGPLADSFSTVGAGNLTDVQLLLSTTGITGTTTVQLLADNSKTPGTPIETLATISDSSLSSSPALVDVSGFAPVALTASTRYWIELSSSASSAFWSWSLDTSGPGVANEFFSNGNGVVANVGNGPYQMQVTVSGSAVPEPSTLVIGMIAGGCLFVTRRKWRS